VARPAKYSSEQILDTAATLLASGGPQRVTVGAIASAIGGPTGSIYHRFATRDLILARLWIRTVHRAQEGFLEALELPEVRDAAHAAALHIPRFSRGHPLDARVLVLYRRQQLAAAWPEELTLELEHLNRPLVTSLERFGARLPGRLTPSKREAVTMALIDLPYGVTRRHLLADRPPPALVDRLILATCDTLLFAAAE
jgi:AcrR family transcriptional regulator